jgi:CHAD domain-containing protein
LRPWERDAAPATLASPTAAFAAAQLQRRLKHVRRRGKTLDEMALPDLHELRKDCKKFRYAAEFFAPCFPGKQVKAFLKRLSALQQELGALNDTAAASHLMTQLGRAGRGYAAGIVEGWAAASAAPARARVDHRWKKFRTAAPFWAEYRDRRAVAPHETA